MSELSFAIFVGLSSAIIFAIGLDVYMKSRNLPILIASSACLFIMVLAACRIAKIIC